MNKKINESTENGLFVILNVDMKDIPEQEPPNERIVDYKLSPWIFFAYKYIDYKTYKKGDQPEYENPCKSVHLSLLCIPINPNCKEW